MLNRFIRSLVGSALAEQHTPLLVTFYPGRRGAAVEWRLWEAAGTEPDAGPAAGWYKHTNEVYPPSRWDVLAGLIGQGEQTPVAVVSVVYRHLGERSYVAEIGQHIASPYRYKPFDSEIREALLASGWSALPAGARCESKYERNHFGDSLSS